MGWAFDPLGRFVSLYAIVEGLNFAQDDIEFSLTPSLFVTFLHPSMTSLHDNVPSYPLVFVAKLYHTQEGDGAGVPPPQVRSHLVKKEMRARFYWKNRAP